MTVFCTAIILNYLCIMALSDGCWKFLKYEGEIPKTPTDITANFSLHKSKTKPIFYYHWNVSS